MLILKRFQMAQPLVREPITLIAMRDPAICQKVTSLLQVSAIPVPVPASCTGGDADSFASNIVLQGEVSTAYPAVHAARGDQLLGHCLGNVASCMLTSYC